MSSTEQVEANVDPAVPPLDTGKAKKGKKKGAKMLRQLSARARKAFTPRSRGAQGDFNSLDTADLDALGSELDVADLLATSQSLYDTQDALDTFDDESTREAALAVGATKPDVSALKNEAAKLMAEATKEADDITTTVSENAAPLAGPPTPAKLEDVKTTVTEVTTTPDSTEVEPKVEAVTAEVETKDVGSDEAVKEVEVPSAAVDRANEVVSQAKAVVPMKENKPVYLVEKVMAKVKKVNEHRKKVALRVLGGVAAVVLAALVLGGSKGKKEEEVIPPPPPPKGFNLFNKLREKQQEGSSKERKSQGFKLPL